MAVKVAYVVLGFAPAALFVTGFTTWWVRVVQSRAARATADQAA